MMRGRGTHVASAQMAGAQPLPGHARRRTVPLYFGRIIGLKTFLPREAQTLAEIAQVHYLSFFEARAHARIHALVNQPAVGQRRLATMLRGMHAIKPKL